MSRACLVLVFVLLAGSSAWAGTHRHAAPRSHAAIPQSANIERLNAMSLQRARAGQNTAQPLAPPLSR